MTFCSMRRARLGAVVLGMALGMPGAGTAAADCKTELVASQQELKSTAAVVEQVATGPEAGRCPAYRKRYAAMVKFREVLGRCDPGKQRAEHVAQLATSIEGLRKQMPGGCKP